MSFASESWWSAHTTRPPVLIGFSCSALIRQVLQQQLAALSPRSLVVSTAAEAAEYRDAAVLVCTSLELLELLHISRWQRAVVVLLLAGHAVEPSLTLFAPKVSLLSDRYLCTELCVVLEHVLGGQRAVVLDPPALAHLVSPPPQLTGREWAVVCFALYQVDEHTTAQALRIARETITTYWKRMRQKWNGASRFEILDACRVHIVHHLGRLPDNLPGANPVAVAVTRDRKVAH